MSLTIHACEGQRLCAKLLLQSNFDVELIVIHVGHEVLHFPASSQIQDCPGLSRDKTVNRVGLFLQQPRQLERNPSTRCFPDLILQIFTECEWRIKSNRKAMQRFGGLRCMKPNFQVDPLVDNNSNTTEASNCSCHGQAGRLFSW